MNYDEKLTAIWIAFLSASGGLAANIIDPTRRGALGFLGSIFVGAFTGFACGFSMLSLGVQPGICIFSSAVIGVLGNNILSAILVTRMGNRYTITQYNHGSVQANVGEAINNQGDVDQLGGEIKNE